MSITYFVLSLFQQQNKITMSSFLLSAKHFNSTKEALQGLQYDDSFFIPFEMKCCAPIFYDKRNYLEEAINEEIENHINTLAELSAVCVNLQYKHQFEEGALDSSIEMQTKDVLKKTSTVQLSKHGLYNALKCIEYQIETEHLEELRALTREEVMSLDYLRKMINALANSIVMNMPKDQTNSWSID